ncbi:multicopper oxidase family protein [Glaciibacter psychrotolerans]|uniref:Bilirubin oxidase n=1 Tax=Glaciibacter psychrotolerans TaxID=670054 RepID=A0A7Z0ECG5_9MICO|nr:multicopper oxidase domain-containing protein [Leifsonia psychrotolerans]NYJ18640.1 bilirubin oxidase [Leifsonia psychrotolerans]
MRNDADSTPTPPADGPPPIRLSRRTLLLGVGGIVTLGAGGYWITEGRSVEDGFSFDTPLRIPPELGSELIDGERVFRLSAQSGETELVPAVAFATLGFNGAYLAPTIRAVRGERVRVHVTNELDMPTTAHWHGMILPARQDGTPHQTIRPGNTWTAAWQINQPPATLWYHPHPHGQTELQISRGMAGLFLIDPAEPTPGLPSNYGVDDIPLIIQDVTIQPGGGKPGTPTGSPIGRIGNTAIVNGTHRPQFHASTNLVRFRILNASAARCYNLTLSTGEPFHLVATDGGLLSAPVTLTNLLLSPAERAEILVEVRQGAEIVVRSVPHELGMSNRDNIVSGAHDTVDLLRITGAAVLGGQRSLPRSLPSDPLPLPDSASVRRNFVLGDVTINGQTMEMNRIDTRVTAQTTERWIVTNASTRAHNFHIHGTQFTVHALTGSASTVTIPGWKDTVFIPPKSTAELVIPFGDHVDPTTPYMYHCHLLWHEDQGMMAQYTLNETRGMPSSATKEG